MDHVKALHERSAERYVLGEMSALEAEEFEHHYFECQECAVAVEDGQFLVANARAVLAADAEADRATSQPPRRIQRESFWDWLLVSWNRPAFVFAAAAAVLLVAVSVYQGAVVIPGLRHQLGEARVLPAFLLLGPSRGEAAHVVIPRGTPSFALSADIPPDARFPSYLCELSANGGSVFRVTSPPPAEGQPITILVPASGLRPGSYELTIYGADSGGQQRDRISTLGFVLEYH